MISFASRVKRTYRIPEPIANAITRFRQQKPWRGTLAERQAKFEALHDELRDILDIKTSLRFGNENETDASIQSTYIHSENAIVLHGRLSVVTYLYLVIGATGRTSHEAMNFAANVFARFFPRSFAACHTGGPFAVKA